MAKHAKHAKHSQPEAVEFEDIQEQYEAELVEDDPVEESAFFAAEQPADASEAFDFGAGEKKRKGKKTAAIVAASIVGALALAYAVGFGVFSFMFFPNTIAGGNDISMKTSEDVAAMLEQDAANYAFTIEGDGVSLSMTAAEAGIVYDTDAVITDLRSQVRAWAWPYEIFMAHDYSSCLAVEYENTALSDALTAAAEEVNATAASPTNATIGYDAETNGFVVKAEQYGTQIDTAKLIDYVAAQNDMLVENIVLAEEVLVEAEIKQDDQRLADAAARANAYMVPNVDFMIAGQVAVSLNPESMSSWIAMDDQFQVTLSDELKAAWIEQTIEACSTAGNERVYTRPDGKEVTVSGGDYGWIIDGEAFTKLVEEAVISGQQGQVDMPIKQEAQVWGGIGAADWGKRYVDVDLAEQHARFYDADGNLIWESDIVSGGPGASRATPSGVWDLNTNNGYAMLVGRKSDGSIDYETPVNYWMPFKGQSIGLHDANWRGSFGGNIYTYNGSHGCVNLPVSKARELHQIIEVGDVVITHW